ncbi:MAG: DnaJ domain-containing protein [Actinophytocola sp.]|nr:DnaJ domain-containing protein [Actinophytocola sp.]
MVELFAQVVDLFVCGGEFVLEPEDAGVSDMANLPQDPYQVLGVPPNATDAEVTAVYHRRARELHPDIHGNSDLDELRRVLAAYQRVRELRQSAAHSADHHRPESQGVGGDDDADADPAGGSLRTCR